MVQEILCDFANGYVYRFIKSLNTYERAGYKRPDGYLQFSLNGKKIYAHRYLYEKYHNVKLNADQQINHINHKRDDNRIVNLEVVSNQQKTKKYKNNSSGIKGVCWKKNANKWTAQISINGKSQFLGYFSDIEDAKSAWISKATELNEQGHYYYIPE